MVRWRGRTLAERVVIRFNGANQWEAVPPSKEQVYRYDSVTDARAKGRELAIENECELVEYRMDGSVRSNDSYGKPPLVQAETVRKTAAELQEGDRFTVGERELCITHHGEVCGQACVYFKQGSAPTDYILNASLDFLFPNGIPVLKPVEWMFPLDYSAGGWWTGASTTVEDTFNSLPLDVAKTYTVTIKECGA